MRKLIFALLFSIVLTGCNTLFVQMGPTEYGLRFSLLPRFLGGGVSNHVLEPGQLSFLFPWDQLYRIDVSVKSVEWGEKGKNGEYLHTRALDGNEVALAVTVRYQVNADRAGLIKMVHEIATSNKELEEIVQSTASADIRRFMNMLHTSDYLAADERYKAVDAVRDSIRTRLAPYNINILSINLDDFRFERQLPNGSLDASYQEKLDETQRIREETEREKARIDTVVAKKQQEINEVQALVNRQIAEASGYKKQAEIRGDAYLAARQNESQGLLAQGKAEAEGLKEKIAALSGPGGRAMLKIELVKNLLKSDPKFVLLGQGSNTTLDVQRFDANDLMRQAGMIEALRCEEKPQR